MRLQPNFEERFLLQPRPAQDDAYGAGSQATLWNALFGNLFLQRLVRIAHGYDGRVKDIMDWRACSTRARVRSCAMWRPHENTYTGDCAYFLRGWPQLRNNYAPWTAQTLHPLLFE